MGFDMANSQKQPVTTRPKTSPTLPKIDCAACKGDKQFTSYDKFVGDFPPYMERESLPLQ